MNRLRELRRALRVAFGRLTQREQFLLVGGGIVATALVCTLAAILLSSAMAKQQHRVDVKTQQLAQVLALRGEYHQRQIEHAQKLKALSGAQVRLVSLVEEAAKTAGIEIGQLRPEDGEPGSDGVYESRVDLRAAGLSVDRLQEFLNLVEGGPGIIVVRHIKLNRPYHKDLAEVELSVSTFKMKA